MVCVCHVLSDACKSALLCQAWKSIWGQVPTWFKVVWCAEVGGCGVVYMSWRPVSLLTHLPPKHWAFPPRWLTPMPSPLGRPPCVHLLPSLWHLLLRVPRHYLHPTSPLWVASALHLRRYKQTSTTPCRAPLLRAASRSISELVGPAHVVGGVEPTIKSVNLCWGMIKVAKSNPSFNSAITFFLSLSSVLFHTTDKSILK